MARRTGFPKKMYHKSEDNIISEPVGFVVRVDLADYFAALDCPAVHVVGRTVPNQVDSSRRRFVGQTEFVPDPAAAIVLAAAVAQTARSVAVRCSSFAVR